MKEKILIRENTQLAKNKINQLQKIKTEIEKTVLPAFEVLQVGQFTTELLTDVLAGNGDIIKSLVQLQAEQDIKGMKSPSVRKTILANVEQSFQDFQKVCNKIISMECIELLHFIFIEGDNVNLLPDFESVIIESCKEYISNEKELAVYNALLATIKGIELFSTALGKNAIERLGNRPFAQIFSYIISENGKLSIDSQNDYKMLTK